MKILACDKVDGAAIAKLRAAGHEVVEGNALKGAEFIAALDRFKKEHNRNFPSWSEVLHVVKSLGYRR